MLTPDTVVVGNVFSAARKETVPSVAIDICLQLIHNQSNSPYVPPSHRPLIALSSPFHPRATC